MTVLVIAALATVVPNDPDGEPFVVKVVGGGPSVWTIVTAVAAGLSPLVSLLVARYVTTKALRGALAERVWERQLLSASEFAAVVHAATSELRRLDPRRRADPPSGDEIASVGRRVEEAQRALGLINLLFRGKAERVADTASALVSALARARRAADDLAMSAGPSEPATREAAFTSALTDAEDAYQAFLDAAEVATDPAAQRRRSKGRRSQETRRSGRDGLTGGG